jgi:cold shock CspA family protein
MPKGIVTWYERKLAQGIILSESGKDVFVFRDDIGSTPAYLKSFDLVEFDEVQAEDHVRAQNVRAIKVPNHLDPSAEAFALRTMAFTDGKLYKGIVRFFLKLKGFGFIALQEKDIFVHHLVIEGGDPNLEDREIISFSYSMSVKGFNATKVIRDGGASAQRV